MISDKEVGLYWNAYDNTVITDLIRKLVEERARNNAVDYYKINDPDQGQVESCIKSALRDFNIKPEEYKP